MVGGAAVSGGSSLSIATSTRLQTRSRYWFKSKDAGDFNKVPRLARYRTGRGGFFKRKFSEVTSSVLVSSHQRCHDPLRFFNAIGLKRGPSSSRPKKIDLRLFWTTAWTQLCILKMNMIKFLSLCVTQAS